jgi:glycosyltransferase involved in cell wall biosynthesis
MIGPGKEIIGGISVLTQTILPFLEQKVDLLYFHTVNKREPLKSGKLSFLNIILALYQYARFLYKLITFRPHIIHLHTSQGIAWLKDTFFILAGKTLNIKVVLHVHAPEFDELYCKQPPVIRSYTCKIMRLADKVIALSLEWKKRLSQIISNDRIFILRNCIDVKATPTSVNDMRTNALFLGSVGTRKGAFDLIEALGRLKSIGCPLKVWIAGYEEKKGDLLIAQTRKKDFRLGDRYQLLGTVTGEKKTKLLRQASLFVLPSYNEGLPIALLEALASGLPVVSTFVGGIPEVVKDGYNGFLIEAGDIEALTEKLAVLYWKRDLREIMGRRSRKLAEEEFDVRPYVEKLVGLYKELEYR